MTVDDSAKGGFTLKRWSQRKLQAARDAGNAPAATAPAGDARPAPAAPAPVAAASGGTPAVQPPADPATLPPVDSLTMESDFTAFLQPEVGEKLKQQALKRLFRDPHFNVMDGLDVYIDDYSRPDPIAPELVRQLVQGRHIFNPPRTRVNAQGFVEDVPPEELAGKSPPGELTAESPPGEFAAKSPPDGVSSDAPVAEPARLPAGTPISSSSATAAAAGEGSDAARERDPSAP